MPQALKLAEMEQVPEAPQVGRNPFRFGVPPPPPPPPPAPPPVYVPPPPPPPPPAPQVPLKLTMIVIDPERPTRPRAYLVDPKSGSTIEAIEGDIVDGKYKLIKVGTESVVMSFLDGSGQRIINKGS